MAAMTTRGLGTPAAKAALAIVSRKLKVDQTHQMSMRACSLLQFCVHDVKHVPSTRLGRELARDTSNEELSDAEHLDGLHSDL